VAPHVAPGYAPVVFAPQFWNEDLARLGAYGRAVAEKTRTRYENEGVDVQKELREFDPDRPLFLDRCLKAYLPPPAGPWRMVLRRHRYEGTLVLLCIAFGYGHPPRGSSAWTTYERAYRRLYSRDPPRGG
jgi:hypothetical protein